MRQTVRFAVLGLAGLLTLAACGSSSHDPPTVAQGAQVTSTTGAASPVTTTTASPTTAAPTTVAPTATAVAKVAANTASQAEIQKAFEAAGIPSAAQWAKEVTEYRPYPTFAKLRQNLAKYNPGPGVVDQIVAALAL